MTMQVPDKLILGGETWKTDIFFPDNRRQPEIPNLPNFDTPSSNNNRGYVATWRIDDSKLFLLELAGRLLSGKQVNLSHVFPDKAPPIFADWYSGRISVYQGLDLGVKDLGVGSYYEREATLRVEAGRITKSEFFQRDQAAPEIRRASIQIL